MLDALFRGARVLFTHAWNAAKLVIRDVIKEVNELHIVKQASRVVGAAADHLQSKAHQFNEEEADLGAKFARDGKRTNADTDRLAELAAEREQLRIQLDSSNAAKAAEELEAKADRLSAREIDDDEISGRMGVLSAKECPSCHGTMRIRQGHLSGNVGRIKFYWQCTSHPGRCKTISFDPQKAMIGTIREADADFDMDKNRRQEIWTRPAMMIDTHTRLRQHLGDDDEQITCPVHLTPMKLVQRSKRGGLLLDSYTYACMCVDARGMACNQEVQLAHMGQVAAALKRTEGRGII